MTTPPITSPNLKSRRGERLSRLWHAAQDSAFTYTVYTVGAGGSPRERAAIDPVSVSGQTVPLTLASAVSHGDTVTVSYDIPSGDDVMKVRDAPGNRAHEFTDREVTNQTPDTTAPTRSRPR